MQNRIADIEQAVKALLVAQLPGVDVQSVGTKDIDDDGTLIFKPPCVRTLYAGSEYTLARDNLALAYDALHYIDVYVCDDNLASEEAQREDSKQLLDQVLPILVGARLALSDGPQPTDPIVMRRVAPFLQDIVGMTYVASFAVPCIAQFPGTNNPTL